MDETLTWPRALEATGYLSKEQAARHFNVDAATVEHGPEVFLWKDALWSRPTFAKGAHIAHRQLVSETYIRLHPVLSRWQTAGSLYGLFPDAIGWVSQAPWPILLEMDTGKENAKQWASKLAEYRLEATANPRFALWVIALGGKLRTGRLQSWIQGARLSVPVHFFTLDDLTKASCQDALRDLPEQFPPSNPPPEASETEQALYRLWPANIPVGYDEAQRLLHQGMRCGAREVTSQGIIYYLRKP